MSMGFLEVFSFRHNCTDIVVAVYKIFVQFCQENPLGGKFPRVRSCEKGLFPTENNSTQNDTQNDTLQSLME